MDGVGTLMPMWQIYIMAVLTLWTKSCSAQLAHYFVKEDPMVLLE